MTLGPVFFASPWALAVLLALPLLWLVLRAAPPAPNRVVFPPLRLLLDLRTAEETTGRPPWWLLALRALAVSLLILGFARPSLAPDGSTTALPAGPVLIVLDDGWPSAGAFDDMRTAASALIARAERGGQSVSLLTTAPSRSANKGPLDAMTPADARVAMARLELKPWRPDRAAAAARLSATPSGFGEVHWLSDGLDDDARPGFVETLRAKGPVTVKQSTRPVLVIDEARTTAKGVEARVRRISALSGGGMIAADTTDGRPLGAADITFAPGALEALVLLELPPEIAARAARLRIISPSSAGGVRLIPNAAGRPVVGLIDPGGQGQPLLSDLYYVDRAIEPFAQTRRGTVEQLIEFGAQALVLPDASRLTPPEQRAVERWLEAGGLLLRFAGPRLANDSDSLVPAPLRRGARQLGGALGWEKPQTLRAFDADSPFFGLEVNPDVTVNRHIMIAPEGEQQAQIWARLADGAPIISAATRGKGQLVLVHVSAGPDWSTLPLSGLYVEVLRRTLTMAGRVPGSRTGAAVAAGPYELRRMIDGAGAWIAPPPDANPIPAEAFDAVRAGPAYPPGLYERGGVAGAVQSVRSDEPFEAMAALEGVVMSGLTEAAPRPLAGVFLGLGGALIALDLLLALWLAGRLPLPQFKTASVFVLASLSGIGALFSAAPASAQNTSNTQTVSDVQLAYVRTGDARMDAAAKSGLDKLAQTLRDRTAVEPGPTVAVDLARDDLSLFPILFWTAPANPRPLPDAALANLDRYMRLGGMVFLDTRSSAGPSTNPGPAAVMLRGLDAPPLEQVGAEHVLTRSFYLMQAFPGRIDAPRLFAETASSAAARDGVPALLIGDGDWVATWASSSAADQVAWYDDDARRREMALRFGVNLVMMALTGNYKADQVHVPALLERMGGGR